jgi:protein-L-isoaspartate(D-aspartate) O-methyltransferase
VIGIERQHELVEIGSKRLQLLGYDNVVVVEGDGTKGWPERAPYDAILVAASGSHVPEPLIDQLKTGGRLVMPLGEPGWNQKLIRILKSEDGSLQQLDLGAVRFVPLIGERGWKDA